MSDTQDNNFLQFMEITNASASDATHYLEMTNSLEEAIQLYFLSNENGGTSNPDVQIIDSQPPQEQSSRISPVLQPVQNPIRLSDLTHTSPPRQDAFDVLPDNDEIEFPNEDTDIDFESFHELAPHLQGFLSQRSMGQFSTTHFRPGPIAPMRPNRLSEMFPPPEGLTSSLTLSAGLNTANAAGKWVFLILSDPSVFKCQEFNRDILGNQILKELLSSSFYCIYYQNNSRNHTEFTQMYPYASSQVPQYPYACILDPRTGERISQYTANNSLFQHMDPGEWALEFSNFLESHDLEIDFMGGEVQKQEKRVEEMTEEEQIQYAMRLSSPTGNESPRDSKDIIGLSNNTSDGRIQIVSKKLELTSGTRMKLRYPDGKQEQIFIDENTTMSELFGHVKVEVNDHFDLWINGEKLTEDGNALEHIKVPSLITIKLT
eukprot:NODE_339_length_9219_cov_0.924232.p4 type:complete len:432 gc:universal NODE_339_length_9219_cov_0.924232:6481-5186(-)